VGVLGACEDGPGGYSMIKSSDDDGRTWSRPCYILKEPPTPNGFNGTFLWPDPQGQSYGFGMGSALCPNPKTLVFQ
jgi:hypothetical protein